MKTVKIYEKTETKELQEMIKLCERGLDIIDEEYINQRYSSDLEKNRIDLIIDTNLIRMELNKRLWKNEF